MPERDIDRDGEVLSPAGGLSAGRAEDPVSDLHRHVVLLREGDEVRGGNGAAGGARPADEGLVTDDAILAGVDYGLIVQREQRVWKPDSAQIGVNEYSRHSPGTECPTDADVGSSKRTTNQLATRHECGGELKFLCIGV